jgi:hypothetical protein
METSSLSKRLDALSAQHGGKIPFGSMKGQGKGKGKDKGQGKGKGKTTRRRGNNSKKHTRKSLTRQRRKSKGRASKSKHKGEPPMSPKHLGEKVIQRGRDLDLYEVNEGGWVKVELGKMK